jgi:hypothetical protein
MPGCKSFSSRPVAPERSEGGSEGAFKGIVVLPVREIGEVMFADGFRQLVATKSDEGGSLAGGRVQTRPFFNVA